MQIVGREPAFPWLVSAAHGTRPPTHLFEQAAIGRALGRTNGFWTAFQALILGVVEGITEFLPISSTGHQIIVADLIGFGGERFQAFNIIIQLGAILAVVWEYRRKIFDVVVGPRERSAQRFTGNLLVAFFPAVILGVAFADLIHHYLFNPITVATALVIGGVIMLWAERRDHLIQAETVDDMTWKQALKVGLARAWRWCPAPRGPAPPSSAGCCSACRARQPPSSPSSSPCPPWSARRCTRATSTATCSSPPTCRCSPWASWSPSSSR